MNSNDQQLYLKHLVSYGLVSQNYYCLILKVIYISNKHFISYSKADGKDFAYKLRNALLSNSPPIQVWLDEYEIKPGIDWDEQIVEGIRTCVSLIFIMTYDSVKPQSICKKEWTRALRYKKPIIPILLHKEAEMPFNLDPRQYINFTEDFDNPLKELQAHLQWLLTPEGVLHAMNDRLADAQRDLLRAVEDIGKIRIQEEI
ncbi:MAG: toll/interleukin-1 receptor domain-containing protein, partial [Promethearchaeia archaeon]